MANIIGSLRLARCRTVAHEYEYDEKLWGWTTIAPEASFNTEVEVPAQKRLEGFDVAA
jgi:hypothetical protein